MLKAIKKNRIVCYAPPKGAVYTSSSPRGVIGHRAVLPCSVPVVPSFLFSFFFFHTIVFSFPGGSWFGSVLCLTFLDRPGPGRGLDLLNTLSFSFAVSFQKAWERERERAKEMESGADSDRERQRQTEREREREREREKGKREMARERGGPQ